MSEEWPFAFEESNRQVRARLHENRLSLEFEISGKWEDFDDPAEINGFLKWDGCFNWATNADCMAHCCELDDFAGLLRCLEKLHDVAAENVKSWCGTKPLTAPI